MSSNKRSFDTIVRYKKCANSADEGATLPKMLKNKLLQRARGKLSVSLASTPDFGRQNSSYFCKF